jgi:predicted secreted protein
MNFYAIFAIYALFWTICAFIVLPFGIRTPDETGEVLLKGQADSAPSNFQPGKVVIRATIMSAVLFGLYYANYVEGWVTVDQIPGYHSAG